MIKAIIFDADGTLYEIKTERAYSLAADFLSKKTGIPAVEIMEKWKKIIDEIKSLPVDWSNPAKRWRKYALRKSLFALGVDENKVSRIADEALVVFWQAAIEDLEVFPENIKKIESLSKNYPLVVASEEFRENLIPKLNRVFGSWEKYFKFLITPEDTGIMKPSEKYCLLATKKLNLPPGEALAVGDSEERDLAPAKKLGLKTLKLSACELPKLAKIIATIK